MRAIRFIYSVLLIGICVNAVYSQKDTTSIPRRYVASRVLDKVECFSSAKVSEWVYYRYVADSIDDGDDISIHGDSISFELNTSYFEYSLYFQAVIFKKEKELFFEFNKCVIKDKKGTVVTDPDVFKRAISEFEFYLTDLLIYIEADNQHVSGLSNKGFCMECFTVEDALREANSNIILIIDTKKLKSIKDLAKIKNLKILWLNVNSAIDLDSVFSVLKNISTLEELQIGGKKVKSIPNSIGRLISLNNLCITKTSMENLPDSIGRLYNLTVFNGCCGNISTFPNEICRLSKLEFLNLSGNKIEKVPDGVFSMPRLKVLSLQDNRILDLPKRTDDSNNLVFINISNNKLTNLSFDFKKMKSLRVLDIDLNTFDDFPTVLFDIPNLWYYNNLFTKKWNREKEQKQEMLNMQLSKRFEMQTH